MNNDELFKALADCMTELEAVWKASGSKTENSYVTDAKKVIEKNQCSVPETYQLRTICIVCQQEKTYSITKGTTPQQWFNKENDKQQHVCFNCGCCPIFL